MPEAIKTYVRFVDRWSWYFGLFSMYMIFAMIAILTYATITKVFFMPSLWTVEMAQFVMVVYFMLGGAYTLREEEHVRMDLLYSGWSVRKRAKVDLFTGFALIIFLIMLQIGGIASLIYSFSYWERAFSAWRPYMWPVKLVINIGLFMTLLQAIAIWFKDLAKVRGEPIT